MIFFEDKDGLCCLPRSQVVAITPAFPERLRIDCADGSVGYCYSVEEKTQSGMCRYSTKKSFDPQQLRRIEKARDNFKLQLASGEQLNVTPAWVAGVRTFLGLDQYRPQPESLTRLFLREYPFEIVQAPAPVLKEHFPSARHLIAALLWQTVERVRQGLGTYGKTHHGYFYRPVQATLERAGMLNQQFTKDVAEDLYQRMLSRMVREDRLFDYRDLGFKDAYVDEREIGKLHPHILLLIEKDSLADAGIAAARHCGISWILSGGVARIIRAEFFCAALQQVYCGPTLVIDYGDFDPGGWLNGEVFVRHLERFGTVCGSGPHYLVRPELYTQEEIELFGRPLSAKDGRVDDWLKDSGGIDGQPRGIHADWLQPPDRVLNALDALLAVHQQDFAGPPQTIST